MRSKWRTRRRIGNSIAPLFEIFSTVKLKVLDARELRGLWLWLWRARPIAHLLQPSACRFARGELGEREPWRRWR